MIHERESDKAMVSEKKNQYKIIHKCNNLFQRGFLKQIHRILRVNTLNST